MIHLTNYINFLKRKFLYNIILSTLSHIVSCVSVVTGMVQAAGGGGLSSPVTVIPITVWCRVRDFTLNDTSSLQFSDGVVVKRSTAGTVYLGVI